ncbi:ATP-binding protein (plasmid) [Streptomyces sp. NBC_00464]|uniref:ATP-binding protein n=1 Tax=Streptomyces sp. NBC_00464 TaxID=2975751 RepID=UPI002E173B73
MRIGLDMSIGRAPTGHSGGLSAAEALWPRKFRRIIATSLRAWRHPRLVETAELLVSELVTNAFQHGRGDIRVRLYFSVSHFVIEVRDGNPAAPELRNTALDDEDGRGLHLVDALSDAWGTSDDGTSTWCSLPAHQGFANVPPPAAVTDSTSQHPRAAVAGVRA